MGHYLPVDSEVGGLNLGVGKSLFVLTRNVRNDAEERRDKNWTRLNSLVSLSVCNCLGSCIETKNKERKEFDGSISFGSGTILQYCQKYKYCIINEKYRS